MYCCVVLILGCLLVVVEGDEHANATVLQLQGCAHCEVAHADATHVLERFIEMGWH